MAEISLAETRLAQLQRELDAARAELQDFTSTVSHDLRAPLRHITSFAQVIAEDWPDMPDEVAGHLGTIREAAQLLSRQLDGLTQLSRLGTRALDIQPVNVSALAQAVVDELGPQAGPNVQWQIAADVPLVLADADLLRQVLTHLLDNALKFSRGRASRQISLAWTNVEGQSGSVQGAESGVEHGADAATCCFSIRDNGVGFRPEQAQRLFKVFAKLHPAREFEGLGLGLVTCRKIIGRLGGSIRIQGAADAGCQVMLWLPAAPACS
ncbi:ATP-binding protein [Rhodoferax sp.]|uniref:sensor histidine kinase n=1 Tax=Rhodoferax sp. TaxID=50421 RepID=UPI00283FA1D7|nr:ATP-binding protein [Rhodoferax sp.]MDR3371406.1 ATP-binding protein [Rhodoferax sp.]